MSRKFKAYAFASATLALLMLDQTSSTTHRESFEPASAVNSTSLTAPTPTLTSTTSTTVGRSTTTEASRGTRRTPSTARHSLAGNSPDILQRIARCESGGSYTAANRHSTASGKYQVLDSTWGGYGGYRRAKDAPPDVQEAQAQAMYARSGVSPWAASAGCWG